MSRLKLTDTLAEAVLTLSDNDHRAMEAIGRMLRYAPQIDPSAGPTRPILQLNYLKTIDTMRISGSEIWALYHDLCGEDLIKSLALFRAFQLGLVDSADVILGSINPHRCAIDLDELLTRVQAEIPDFGANPVRQILQTV